jgi:hypothetical protein
MATSYEIKATTRREYAYEEREVVEPYEEAVEVVIEGITRVFIEQKTRTVLREVPVSFEDIPVKIVFVQNTSDGQNTRNSYGEEEYDALVKAEGAKNAAALAALAGWKV